MLTIEKVVVCYSGGHSSALTAIESVRKYGKKNVILLNHDISSKVEHADIKRFKRDVADYLDIDITYANMPDFEEMTPLQVSIKKCGFQADRGKNFCTYCLKIEPFHKWLNRYFPSSLDNPCEDIKIAYGFDLDEPERITRRSQHLGTMGYKTWFPLIEKGRSIVKIEDVGISRPITYKIYKHANCMGCLKAGWQHWYLIYCLHPDIWEDGKRADEAIGYSIHSDYFLKEKEAMFQEMRFEKGICPSEKLPHQTFWEIVRRTMPGEQNLFPCDCAI